MAQFVLPVDSNDTNYTLDVTLSGVSYTLGLYWNTRGGFWSLDFYDAAGDPIATGIKLVADWELISQFADSAMPPGFLYCVDTSGQSLDPGVSDLGSRVILVYDDGQD